MEYKIYNSKAEVDAAMYAALSLCTPCVICGESIPVNKHDEDAFLHGFYVHNQICDKCKAAILYVREQMEQKEN